MRSTTSNQVNTGNFVLGEILLQIISLINVRLSNRGIPTTTVIRSIQVGTVELGLSRERQDIAGSTAEQPYLLQPFVDFVMDSA